MKPQLFLGVYSGVWLLSQNKQKVLLPSPNLPAVTFYLLLLVLALPLQECLSLIFALYSYEIGEDSSKIPLPWPYLRAKQANSFELFVTGQFFKSAYHIDHLPIDSVQYAPVFFTLGSANLEAVFHLQHHKGLLKIWFSFGGWNCLQANLWNEGLSIKVSNPAMLWGSTHPCSKAGAVQDSWASQSGELSPKLCWWGQRLNRLQFGGFFPQQLGLCSADTGEIFC